MPILKTVQMYRHIDKGKVLHTGYRIINPGYPVHTYCLTALTVSALAKVAVSHFLISSGAASISFSSSSSSSTLNGGTVGLARYYPGNGLSGNWTI